MNYVGCFLKCGSNGPSTLTLGLNYAAPEIRDCSLLIFVFLASSTQQGFTIQ